MPTGKQLSLLRDNRRSYLLAWRFLILNLFQINSTLLFASLAWLGIKLPGLIPYQTFGAALFASAATAYLLLLVNPAAKWIRVTATALPVCAVGSRIYTLTYHVPEPQWTGIAVWGFIGFIFVWVAPRLMPPPLRNGERRRWLADESGRKRVG